MNLPDPDDPLFLAEMRDLRMWLFAAFCILAGFGCLAFAYLSP